MKLLAICCIMVAAQALLSCLAKHSFNRFTESAIDLCCGAVVYAYCS